MEQTDQYTTIRLSNETKERFEKARSTIPYENAATTEDFLNYLLDILEKKKK